MAQIAMIGDSPRCDRDGPKAVGIKGFHLDRSDAGPLIRKTGRSACLNGKRTGVNDRRCRARVAIGLEGTAASAGLNANVRGGGDSGSLLPADSRRHVRSPHPATGHGR